MTVGFGNPALDHATKGTGVQLVMIALGCILSIYVRVRAAASDTLRKMSLFRVSIFHPK